MPAASKSRRSKQKFMLGIKEHKLALEASQAEAAKAVAAGKKAVAAAKKKKDYEAVAANLEMLAKAKKAHTNLTASIKLIASSCCDQVFGCDPFYV